MPSSHRCSVLPVIHLRSSHPSPEKRFGGPLIPGLPIIKGSRVVSEAQQPSSIQPAGQPESTIVVGLTKEERQWVRDLYSAVQLGSTDVVGEC
ncbi:hypothetical protein AAC387_Pa05g0229 [Persea americana]